MTYTLSAGNEAGHFDINGTTGEITLAAAGVGNLSGPYVLTRRNSVGPTTQEITITVIPDAVNVDATHPLAETIGPDTHSYTLPKSTTCFQFTDGTWAVVPPDAGLEITTFLPTPAERSVTDYGNTTTNYDVDGAQRFGPWTYDLYSQGFDERCRYYSSGLRLTAPITLARGNKILTAKSADVPGSLGGTFNENSRSSVISSANIVTVLDALPDTSQRYYRPGLFHSAAVTTAANLIPEFDIADWPTLATPTLVNMDGDSFSADWDNVDFGARVSYWVHYDPIAAFGIFRNTQNPASAIYEAWGARYQMWAEGTAAGKAYNYNRYLIHRFLRQRVDKTSDADALEIINEIIQHALDYDSLCEAGLAASQTIIDSGEPGGGHVNVNTQLLIIGCWALQIIGTPYALTVSERLFDRLTEDSPDIMPKTQRQWQVNVKSWSAANRSASNFDGYTGTFGTSSDPDNAVNFNINFVTEGLSDQNTSTYVYNRTAEGLLGVQFKITSGSADPGAGGSDQIYAIVGVVLGGDGYSTSQYYISPKFVNGTPPASGDGYEFLVAPDETIGWVEDMCGGDGTTMVGHNAAAYTAYIGNNIAATAYPRWNSVYAYQNMPQHRTAYLAMQGLECGLWSGGAETLPQNVKYKQFWEIIRNAGKSIYDTLAGTANNYDIWTDEMQALTRAGLHDGQGNPDWDNYWGAKDAVVPTLTGVGADAVNLTVTTDYPFHRIYGVVTTSATAPTAAQIRAGDDHTGADATLAVSLAVSTIGAKTIAHSLADGSYHVHFVQDTPSGNSSAVTSGAFSLGVTPPLYEYTLNSTVANSGTIGGNAAWIGTPTYLDNAASFPGDNTRYVKQSGYGVNVTGKSAITVEAEFKLTTTGVKQWFVSNTSGIILEATDSYITFSFQTKLPTTYPYVTKTGITPTDNAWHTIKATWNNTDGVVTLVYDGGTPVTSTFASSIGAVSANAGDGLFIGQWNGTWYANGLVRNVRIYDEVV